jgi:hypothetical protein
MAPVPQLTRSSIGFSTEIQQEIALVLLACCPVAAPFQSWHPDQGCRLCVSLHHLVAAPGTARASGMNWMGGGLRKLAGMKDGTIEHAGFRQRASGALTHRTMQLSAEQGGSRAPAGVSGAVAASGHPRLGNSLAPAPLPTSERIVFSDAAPPATTAPTAAARAIDLRDSPAAASSMRPIQVVRPSHRAAVVAPEAGNGTISVAHVFGGPTAAAHAAHGASEKPKAASGPGQGRSAVFSSTAAAASRGKSPVAGSTAAERYIEALGGCAATSAASARQLFLALRPSKAGSSPLPAAARVGAGGASHGSSMRFPDVAGMDVAGLLAPAKRMGGRSAAAGDGFPLGPRSAGKQAPMQVTVLAGRKRKPSERH